MASPHPHFSELLSDPEWKAKPDSEKLDVLREAVDSLFREVVKLKDRLYELDRR